MLIKNYLPGVIVCFSLLHTFVCHSQELKLETAVQIGHYENINLLSYSRDGRFLVTASEDQTLKLWDGRSGREIRTFTGSTRDFQAISISPDGKLLATVNRDSSAWIWNLATGEVLNKFLDAGDIINNAVFTNDGKYLITSARENTAMLWDISTGKIIRYFDGDKLGCYNYNCRASLDVDSKGKGLIVGVGDRTTLLFDISTGKLLQRFKENTGSCSSCMTYAKFDNSGNIFSVEYSGLIRQWKPATGKEMQTTGEKEDYEGMDISNNGSYLATQSRSRFRILDPKSLKEIRSYDNYKNHVNAFAFSPDEKTLAVANNKRQILLINIVSGDTLKTLGGLITHLDEGMNDLIRNWIKNKDEQDVSPDGHYIVRGKLGRKARIWDLTTGRIVHDLIGHEGIVTASKFSPDGKLVVTGSTDNAVRLWDAESGKEIRAMKGHGGPVFSVAFSPDGKYVVSGGWDGRCILWDVATGHAMGIYRFHGETAPITVSFTPNGMYLLTAGLDHKLILGDIDSGEIVRDFMGHTNNVPSIKYSSDGKYMLTAGWDGMAFMWDLATGLKVQRFRGHQGPVYDIAVNNKGDMVATGGLDKEIRIWDPVSGEQIKTLTGHLGAVTSLTFSQDGRQLISGSRDGSTRVWDIQTGQELFAHYFAGENDWLVKSPDGYFYSTDGARNSIFFVRGFESYNIERFFEDFYRPGLIKEIFGNIRTRTRELNIINKLDSSPSPEVEVISPKNNTTTEIAQAEVLVKITNMGGGISEIRVKNNGKIVISDKEDLDKVTRQGKSIYKSYKVPLIRGENYLAVSAFSHGRIESSQEYTEVNLGGEIRPSNCYIMAIGINNYQNPRLNLNYAYADARGFVDLIKQDSKKLFKNIKVTELFDERATRKNILESLDKLIGEVGPQDVFYFYYAGHGSLVDDKFYFIPTENTRLYEQESLDSAAIYAGLLKDKLQKIQALKQVVIVDACHSGGSTEILAERGAGEEKALAQLSRSAGVHIMASAGSEQTAGEFKDLGHGIFTYVLLKALSGEADGAPKDGKVTVYELKSYLDDQVPELSKKFKGSPQYPNTFSRGNDFPLAIQ